MADYVRKTQNEIERLDDEGILAYIEMAREAEDLDGAKQAAGLLAFRHQARVAKKVAVRAHPDNVDDIVMNVMESTVRSAFDGRYVGQFHSFVNTITSRRIVDFYRKRERSPRTFPLPDEHVEEDGVWVRQGVDEVEFKLTAYRELAEQVCRERNDVHRAVIRLYGHSLLGFEELDAATTKAEIELIFPGETITEGNIHQIWRRFKKDYADAWEAADEPREGVA